MAKWYRSEHLWFSKPLGIGVLMVLSKWFRIHRLVK
jgi:hypothetical protein